MRKIWSLLCLVMLTGAVQAAPSPLPPDDFAGDQYIDEGGCVFNRDGDNWKPRLDKRGRMICGFPPSLSARRTDPDTVSVLPPLNPPEPPDPEKILLEELAAGLRQGEFLADPRMAEKREEPVTPRSDGGLGAEIAALAQQKQTVQAIMMGAPSNSALCALLGYRPAADSGPILGRDVTQGMCPGMRANLPGKRIIAGRRAEHDKIARQGEQGGNPHGEETDRIASAASGATVDTAARPKMRTGKTASQADRPARSGGHMSTRIRPARDHLGSKPELIPATARYVQVGRFPDDASADGTIRKLAQMGYPVARGYDGEDEPRRRVILAGPFSDRRSLVAALNMLRDNGYDEAAAR